MADVTFAEGIVRKIWPNETELLEHHLLRLDRESRRMRFGHTVADTFISEYATRSAKIGGITYGYLENGELRAAAELRKLGDGWGTEAEAAFSVEKDWQNKGIGTELMGRVIRAARNRGVGHLYVSCLAENAQMQRIAKKHEAVLRFEYGDVVGDIVPDTPTYYSWIEETLEDHHAFMIAVLDLRERVFRVDAA